MIVAVICGGRSSEREVSLLSGAAVREGVELAGHEVRMIEIDGEGRWLHEGSEVALSPGHGLLDADVVFPVLHGPFGEDGTIQGLLEMLDVAYVGCGVRASAVCIDKLAFKQLIDHLSIPQVPFVALTRSAYDADRAALEGQIAQLGLPLFVKPARLGSSVGIVRVADAAELPAALEQAFTYDPRVIVEAASAGIEVECSVLGTADAAEVSVAGEIVVLQSASPGGWYDYEAKYTPGGMDLVVPARISALAAQRVRELAIRAFSESDCCGLARADFFVDGDDVLVNELNTMPGFTSTSVYARLWQESWLEYPDLCQRLLEIALARHREQSGYRF
jgi:D-alanine-D-alanine ligase